MGFMSLFRQLLSSTMFGSYKTDEMADPNSRKVRAHSFDLLQEYGIIF